MFQRKIDKTFKELPNEFSIADKILVVGYKADGKDHEKTVQRVLQICRQVNLKFNKEKFHLFQVYISPIIWGSHIVLWSQTRSTEAQGTYGNAIP